MNPNDSEIAEIKEKLKQMRAESRLVATDNRKLIAQIKQIEFDTQLLHKNGTEHSSQLTATLQKMSREIDNEVVQRTNTRKERKRNILSDIRVKTEENKILANQVKSLENEILRIKQIQDTYSGNIAKKKIGQTKRSRLSVS